MKKLFCYELFLETTNCLHNAAKRKDGTYIEVECGRLYVIAECPEDATRPFTGVLSLKRLGVAYGDQ